MTAQNFEHIYKEYGKKLFRICMVFVKDDNVAAEMVQEIFCSVWERRETLTIKSNWENYLYRAAKFKYYNHYRNMIAKQRSLENYTRTIPKFAESVEEKVHYGQIMEKVDTLVETLPTKRKEVYKMSREEGLNNKEISQMLNISEKTVKNQLTKSLSFLRLNLAQYKG